MVVFEFGLGPFRFFSLGVVANVGRASRPGVMQLGVFPFSVTFVVDLIHVTY